jgi:4-diphosphocytidyl-2-C-methyl-D-erythritol kinase
LQPLPSLSVVLVIPAFGVSTADAYRDLSASRDPNAPHNPALLTPVRLAGWEAIAEDAVNDFEPVVFDRHPQLAQIKRVLSDAGAAISMMSGSGSTMFGTFTTERAASRAARRIREAFSDVRTIETATIAWTSTG